MRRNFRERQLWIPGRSRGLRTPSILHPDRASTVTVRSSCPVRNPSQPAYLGAHVSRAFDRLQKHRAEEYRAAWPRAGRCCNEPGGKGLIETRARLPSAKARGACQRGHPDGIQEVASGSPGGSLARSLITNPRIPSRWSPAFCLLSLPPPPCVRSGTHWLDAHSGISGLCTILNRASESERGSDYRLAVEIQVVDAGMRIIHRGFPGRDSGSAAFG